MEVHIYSIVNAESQAGQIMRQKYNDNTKGQSQKKISSGS